MSDEAPDNVEEAEEAGEEEVEVASVVEVADPMVEALGELTAEAVAAKTAPPPPPVPEPPPPARVQEEEEKPTVHLAEQIKLAEQVERVEDIKARRKARERKEALETQEYIVRNAEQQRRAKEDAREKKGSFFAPESPAAQRVRLFREYTQRVERLGQIGTGRRITIDSPSDVIEAEILVQRQQGAEKRAGPIVRTGIEVAVSTIEEIALAVNMVHSETRKTVNLAGFLKEWQKMRETDVAFRDAMTEVEIEMAHLATVSAKNYVLFQTIMLAVQVNKKNVLRSGYMASQSQATAPDVAQTNDLRERLGRFDGLTE